MPGHYADNFIAYIIPLNSSVFHEVGITTPILQIGKLRFRVVKFLTSAHSLIKEPNWDLNSSDS